ncbi:MAG: peptidase S8 [Bdellovibrionales bacterium GWA2_49_15]|nr:MAG: peptidase S8 [Bdellovibrionales bacterium GWA2_49_15]
MKKDRLFRISIGMVVIFVCCAGFGRQNGPSVQALILEGLKQNRPFVANEILVQFRADTNDTEKKRVRELIGSSKKDDIAKGKNGADLELMTLAKAQSLRAVINNLFQEKSIEFAEPNWIVHHTDISNDPYFTNGSLWGMYGDNTSPANQFGSRASEAWATSADCSDVVVGIIDEGYMYTHPDLAANAYKNPGEIAGNGIDDDSNGYVDDVYGWDFDKKDNSVFDGVKDDHGTHVAGTIGAVGGNSQGVAGVCWSVKILSAKFLGNRGGTIANAIKAVDYFTAFKLKGLNLVATNNSWGGGGYSQGLYATIQRAAVADLLFIAAAGNDGRNNDTTISYPSGYDLENIIAVAALTSTGAMASYSNYGSRSVDIAAPGSGIWSTIPKSSFHRTVSAYASYSGTSMATPHVTGAAALYKARNPSAIASEIKDAILHSATPTPSLKGKVLTEGRLNVETF